MKFAANPTGARLLSPVVLILFLFAAALASQAQTERKYPGRGAVSARDFAKLTSPANGTSAADQVCARYASQAGGSAKTDPGTAKGSYMIVVTGTAGGGPSQYGTSVNVPITIQ